MTSHLKDVDPLRHKTMPAFRSRDTKPELSIRKLLYSMNYRYRLHRSDLPCRPDLAFMSRKKVIFVHGCFWHHHEGCRKTTTPKTRPEFWKQKFERNIKRDQEAEKRFSEKGWYTLTIWECETKKVVKLERKLRDFLGEEVNIPNYCNRSKACS